MTTTSERRAPVPGSAEWLSWMTASKVAAVMGTSPFESRFSLWHRMAGQIGGEVENDEMRYGLVIEPALVAWFAQAHPELTLDPAAPTWITWPTDERRWAATPDAIVIEPDGRQVPLEVKTGRDAWEWAASETLWSPGEPLAIPPGYHDQVQWQIALMGSTHGYVAADVMMSLRWYRIDADPERVQAIMREVDEFMASLARHEAPPIDGSTFTYQAIRELHPDIDDVDVQANSEDAEAWLAARQICSVSERIEREARSRLIDAMGNARRLTWGEHTLLTRQSKNGGTPYAVAGRHLPDLS